MTTVKSNTVKLDVVDQVAVITLNRPEKRNAIDAAMAEAIEMMVDRLESDPALRVGILRAEMGQGQPVFCAGHDLKHFRDHFGTDAEDAVTTARGGFAGITRRERQKPMIAVVDGLATSGGCEMVLACDIVVASDRAAFALAEVKWNLVASAGGSFRLPRAIGRFVATDALLTGESIPAERAYQLGLVSRLTSSENVDGLAMEIARKICRNGPRAVRLSRHIAAVSASIGDEEAWQMLDAAAREVRNSRDLHEGLAAFAERREPRWTGE